MCESDNDSASFSRTFFFVRFFVYFFFSLFFYINKISLSQWLGIFKSPRLARVNLSWVHWRENLVGKQNMKGCCASCFAIPQSPHFFFVGESDTDCLSHYKDHFSSYDFLSTFLSFFILIKSHWVNDWVFLNPRDLRG